MKTGDNIYDLVLGKTFLDMIHKNINWPIELN